MLGFFSIECNFFSYESRMILHVVFFQIDSSSTPNRVTLNNEKYVEGDEEQELMTPNSRGKHKKTPGASGETYQAKKSPRVLPTRSKVWECYTRIKENRDK